MESLATFTRINRSNGLVTEVRQTEKAARANFPTNLLEDVFNGACVAAGGGAARISDRVLRDFISL